MEAKPTLINFEINSSQLEKDKSLFFIMSMNTILMISMLIIYMSIEYENIYLCILFGFAGLMSFIRMFLIANKYFKIIENAEQCNKVVAFSQ